MVVGVCPGVLVILAPVMDNPLTTLIELVVSMLLAINVCTINKWAVSATIRTRDVIQFKAVRRKTEKSSSCVPIRLARASQYRILLRQLLLLETRFRRQRCECDKHLAEKLAKHEPEWNVSHHRRWGEEPFDYNNQCVAQSTTVTPTTPPPNSSFQPRQLDIASARSVRFMSSDIDFDSYEPEYTNFTPAEGAAQARSTIPESKCWLGITI